MNQGSSRLQKLREKKRQTEINRQANLSRNPSNDSEVSVPQPKKAAAKENNLQASSGFALTSQGLVMSTPEPPHYSSQQSHPQSRDYEKTPPSQPFLHQTKSEHERMDPPSTSNEKSPFHILFGDATDAWILSHESPEKTSKDDQLTIPSERTTKSKKKTTSPGRVLSPESSYDTTFEDKEDSDYSFIKQQDPCEHLPVSAAPQPDPPEDKVVWIGEDPPEKVASGDDSIKSVDSADEEADTDLIDGSVEDGSVEDSTLNENVESIPQASLESSFRSQVSMDSEEEPLSRHFRAQEEMKQRRTWATFRPFTSSSSSSSFGADELANVYIRDKVYSWIPAKVLEYHRDHAVVAIDPHDSWDQTTILEKEKEIPIGEVHSSMKDVPREDVDRLASTYNIPTSQLRKVFYIDYENGNLPRQNKGEGKHDMADLTELNPASILYNLKDRHFRGKPYTRVGDIVIAMNPCSWIKELYDSSMRDLYSKNLIWEVHDQNQTEVNSLSSPKSVYDRLGFEPHVYEVSSMAYRGLATTGQDQTILVTGESGAGKTETVKIVMNHLATVQKTRPGGVPTEHSTAREIVSRVLRSSPLLEAFGNAATVRNSNSSRFGKFIQLQFQVEPREVATASGRSVPYTDLVGSKCTTYLLEKSRVVNHDECERTFHVFYQLLAAPREFKQYLWPTFADRTASDFSFTAGETGLSLTDAEAWEETIVALEIFKFKGDTLKMLLQALLVILQLGNLVFDQDPQSKEENSTTVKNKEVLAELADMMGIATTELEDAMTSRALKSRRHDDIKVKLSPQVAKESCNALAKEIFARIFDVLVQKINNYTAYPDALQTSVAHCGHISLLDIFGFERFEVNRFEQLCINYANERLHQKYVLDNFNEVKNEYDIEGVDLYDFGLVDNSEVLDLFEGNPGILDSLNEECMRPKGNAESFVYKAKIKHQGSTRMIDRLLHRKVEFGIAHFTGIVEYNAENFVEGNTDKLPDGLLECATKSSNKIIADELTSLLSARSHEGLNGKDANMKKKAANSTVLQKFQSQLKSLMAAMHGTKTRYIRCIKPNADMIPKKTNHNITLQQLECSGLMTALTISRESFPNKLEYEFIIARYACLMEKQIHTLDKLERQAAVQNSLKTWLEPLARKSVNGTKTMPFACGKTKVFFKAGAQDRLEALRMEYYGNAATKIQALTRKLAAVDIFRRTQACIKVIQSFGRMSVEKALFQRKRQAATRLAAWIRGIQSMPILIGLRRNKAATTIQSFARGRPMAKKYRRHRTAAMTIQRATRFLARKTELQGLANDMSNGAQNEANSITMNEKGAVEELRYLGDSDSVSIESRSSAQDELQSEIASLRADNIALKGRLQAAEAQRREMTLKSEGINATISKYDAQVKDILKANDTLVKELYKARQEAATAKRKLYSNSVQIESKLINAEEEAERLKAHHENEIKKLQEALKLSQEQKAQELDALKRELRAKKDKQELQKKSMKDELKKAQQSHQEYLSKLMGVLESTHASREQEKSKIAAEVAAIRLEKDKEINRLQEEVNALRALQKGGLINVRASLDPRSLQQQLGEEEELRARRSAQFDSLVQTLQSLVTESCALPAYVSERSMKSVIEQQERGQKMTEIIETLNHTYKMEEDSQYKTSQTSLSLLQEYVALTAPKRTMRQMRDRISEMNLEISRLKEELREKEFCKRCGVRDAAAMRRIHANAAQSSR